MDEKTAEKGTPENPFDTLQEGLDACDGSGKVIWVDDSGAWKDIFGTVDKEEEEDETRK